MIEINNLTTIKVDGKFLKKVAEKVLKGERKNKIELSIALVNPAKIHQLNKKYRKKNQPTDVLSYTYGNKSGEIVICPEVVKKNAKKFGSSFKKELTRVLIHGILHILEYDHERKTKDAKRMEEKQNFYLNKFK